MIKVNLFQKRKNHKFSYILGRHGILDEASVPLHRKDEFDCKICFLTRKISSLPSTHRAGRSILQVNHHQIKLAHPLPGIP
uniref:Uncharacterized protein n=1 Tax=Triticum urartu TaxID=4572 RepID=A0A8R7P564_TRIUA